MAQSSHSSKVWQSEYQHDEGMRRYMLSVYQYMVIALGITAFVSYVVSTSPQLMQMLFATPLGWIIAFAPLVYVFIFARKIPQMTREQAVMHLSIFAALNGLSLSSIFMMYTYASIFRTFLVTASMFGTMSIYGYMTKKDLTRLGSFAMMAVIGVVIASVINIFFPSDGVSFIISLVGVLAFTILTSYDTQKLKNVYDCMGGNIIKAPSIAVYGSLTLYLDFINLFVLLLRFVGVRKGD